jgi:hypothetical protein
MQLPTTTYVGGCQHQLSNHGSLQSPNLLAERVMEMLPMLEADFLRELM